LNHQLITKALQERVNANGQLDSRSGVDYDAVVVGAGPYGLSAAAHLRERGLEVGVFGKPLHFWRVHMPENMLLRSYWWATSISDPGKRYSIMQYFRETRQQPVDPLPIETFIDYGLWYQQRVVPNVDETYVELIEKKEQHFVLTLSDRRLIQSRTVVMAPGLNYYAHRPAEYDHLPTELISHTGDCHTFGQFKDKKLLIIGGGQGALEAAALAHESGARVELITRTPLVWIEGSGAFPEHRPLLVRLRSPKAGISTGWFSWRLEHFPYYFQRLPRSTKDKLLNGPGRYGPMGASWLKPRVLGRVVVHEQQQVQEAREIDEGVELSLTNGVKLKADHIVLGTGYRVDINKLPMLHPSIVSAMRTYQKAPILNTYFESTLTGMYFVGISSLSSCGPLYRFVVGTDAAARRIAQHIARHVKYQK
jgi:Pyridine nucleotide-disulphide oxidoreductase